jgi:ribosome maturation protein SDO1
MVNVDDARIASLETKNHKFEILVEPDLALEIKQGFKEVKNNLSKLLAVEEVYKNARSGDQVSETALKEEFGTLDLETIVDEILKKGNLDLTTEQKRRLAESKRKELIDYIVKNSINPVTKAPHTYTRVESALETAKIVLDPQKPIKYQIDKIVDKLNEILPLDFKKYIVKAYIPVQYAGKVNSMINKYEVLERKWANEFYFAANVPAGEKDAFLNMISNLTKGASRFELE